MNGLAIPAVPNVTLGKHLRLRALTIHPAINGHIVEHHYEGRSMPKRMVFRDHEELTRHLSTAIKALK